MRQAADRRERLRAILARLSVEGGDVAMMGAGGSMPHSAAAVMDTVPAPSEVSITDDCVEALIH
jgi:hypothetical protein